MFVCTLQAEEGAKQVGDKPVAKVVTPEAGELVLQSTVLV